MSQIEFLRGKPESDSSLLASLRSREELIRAFKRVRAQTTSLCEPLEIEDYVAQSMPDCSPTKWHLAHTSWFFETFVLKLYAHHYASPNSQYDYLFNSYYNLIGERWARPSRGILTRPTVREIFEYRARIEDALVALLTSCSASELEKIAPIVLLGIQHEQQHQELLLTDIKHLFAQNPLRPRYARRVTETSLRNASPATNKPEWLEIDEGIYEIGYTGDEFAFDNEMPRHRVYLNEFHIAKSLVTNGEFIEFMSSDGYERPELWLADGWTEVQTHHWRAPLYWERIGEEWWHYTLSGFRKVETSEPVTHVSYYEASAYAEWCKARLPREEEWEVASHLVTGRGNFVESNSLHPSPEQGDDAQRLHQMFGEVWQWTESSYSPYPGFRAPEGALGEYNGKFMINQMVLRGGSCATPREHMRTTYRNFFPPAARWQFNGIRLAKSI